MDHFQQLRLLEAVLFASSEPVSESVLAQRLPENTDVAVLLEELRDYYSNRGVNLKRIEDKWAFRTADDLASYMTVSKEVPKKLSRAALETLAIIAYHQPVTRAEVEDIRGVALSKGTLDILLEAEWVKPKGRRRAPGRPVTWGTTGQFLDHFGLENLRDLPGIEELKAAGLLERRPGLGTLAMQQSEADFEDEEEQEDMDDLLHDLEEEFAGEMAEETVALDD